MMRSRFLPLLLVALFALPAQAQKPVTDDGAAADDDLPHYVKTWPQLIGGLEGLQQEIRYPEAAKAGGIEGTVFVQFVVDEDGSVRDAEVVRDVNSEESLRDALREDQGDEFDEEAFQESLRVVREAVRDVRNAEDHRGVRKTEVIRGGEDGGLSEEALRVVQQARFQPGMDDGKPVKVRYTLPIQFRLR